MIKKALPEIRECEDCIKIQAMPFQSNQKNVEIELLRDEVEQLQSEIRNAQLETAAKWCTDNKATGYQAKKSGALPVNKNL